MGMLSRTCLTFYLIRRGKTLGRYGDVRSGRLTVPAKAIKRDELLILTVEDPDCARVRAAPVIIPIALRKVPGRPINLENCFIAIDNLPFGVRLTAGVSNDEATWLLTPRQMEEVALVVPNGHLESFTVSIRIVMLDPDGYEFATTIARFDALAKVEPGPKGVAPPLELDFRRFCCGTAGWYQARFGSTEPVPVLRLVDSEDELTGATKLPGEETEAAPRLGVIEQMTLVARAEWEAEENARFARAQEQWHELEEQRRAIQNIEADDRLSRVLADAEERWRGGEAERLAAAEKAWLAAENERMAAHEIRWQSKMAQIFSVLASHGIQVPAEVVEAQALHDAAPGAIAPAAIHRRRAAHLSPAGWRLAAAIVLVACFTALISF